MKNDEQAPHEQAKSAATPYLTARQVAELLQISKSSVFRIAANDATFPALRVVAGGTLRVHAGRLQHWLDSHTQGARRRSA